MEYAVFLYKACWIASSHTSFEEGFYLLGHKITLQSIHARPEQKVANIAERVFTLSLNLQELIKDPARLQELLEKNPALMSVLQAKMKGA